MAPSAAEVVSPELALVCPELREQALRNLPDVPWQTFVATARARTPVAPPPEPTLLHQAALGLVHLLVLAAVTLVGGGAITLALTLVADATRRA